MVIAQGTSVTGSQGTHPNTAPKDHKISSFEFGWMKIFFIRCKTYRGHNGNNGHLIDFSIPIDENCPLLHDWSKLVENEKNTPCFEEVSKIL